MTSEDDDSISEDEMDEIVTRVVDQLRDAGVGAEGDPQEGDDDRDPEEGDDDRDPDQAPPGEHEIDVRVEDDERVADELREEFERRRDAGRERERAAKRRARERKREARERADAFDDLGDRIEAAVESQLAHVADHIEQSLPGASEPSPGPGVVVGPDDAREKAVYKTQLQKGGRVAVPDTELEALGLEPGDTLQVVLYPVD